MKPRMQTLKLSALTIWKRNPRKISPEARAALKASLKRFGCVDPIIVNRQGDGYEVIGGHQRLSLLRESGAKEAPCVVVELPKAEAAALALTLNNPRAQGEWDETLGDLVADLNAEVDLTGLELDLLLRDLEPEPEIIEVRPPRPVKRVWVLVGVPADRYQDHAETVEALQAAEGLVVHVRLE